MVLRGLVDLFDDLPDIAVVATCTNGRNALETIRSLRPGLALLDVRMPEMSGLEVLKAVQQDRLATRIIFLTATLYDHEVFDAVTAGLHGLILKEDAPEALVEVVRKVAAGRRALPNPYVASALQREEVRRDAGRKLFSELTARELEIANSVAEGLSNKEIARVLDISEGTVKVHLHSIYEKLGVANRTALAGCLLTIGYPQA